MHQGIHLGLAESGRLVRLPMNMHTMVCRVIRLQSKLLEQLGRDPTADEIAIASGLGVEKVMVGGGWVCVGCFEVGCV